MLVQLSIRDLVLIERVDLELGAGLSALTGETGAGKSILLDGLNLALGERADSSLVRRGAAQASVAALFQLPDDHPAFAFLDEQGLIGDDPGHISLRRTLKADGGSRAHVNDMPVSAGLLRRLGQLLVEIHGQHDERGLLSPRSHLLLLDQAGSHDALLTEFQLQHRRWQDAQQAHATARDQAEADAAEQEWLQHALGELEELQPHPGEESQLAEQRANMQKGQRLAERLQQIDKLISGSDGALSQLRQAGRRLAQIADESPALQQALDALDRALIEGDQIEAALIATSDQFHVSPDNLEAAEKRLFDLRALARKHRTEVDALADLASDLAERLQRIASADDHLKQLQQAEQAALEAAHKAADQLHEARLATAGRLDKAIAAELPALRLESARFRTRLEDVPLGLQGRDRVIFEIATNSTTDFGPLLGIASGGELSRFILALKVALASRGTAGTLIFDEIDRGVGGATASAIGNRLARVAEQAQVLVVTHSPQVAAVARYQFHIAKSDGRTNVQQLDHAGRSLEIARMLSGETVTDEARAQAEQLLSASAG